MELRFIGWTKESNRNGQVDRSPSKGGEGQFRISHACSLLIDCQRVLGLGCWKEMAGLMEMTEI